MKGGNVFFAKLLLIGRSFFSFLSHQGGIRRENNRHVPAGKSGLGTSPEPYEPQDQAACLSAGSPPGKRRAKTNDNQKEDAG